MAQVVRKKQFTYLPEALLKTQLMHTSGVDLGLFPVVGRPRSADSIAIDRGCDRPHSGRLLTIDQRSAGCLPTPVAPQTSIHVVPTTQRRDGGGKRLMTGVGFRRLRPYPAMVRKFRIGTRARAAFIGPVSVSGTKRK